MLTGHTGTFSKTENRVLMDTDLYGIGSSSKIYTTVAVMQLAGRREAVLDAPVTRYLKDFKMAIPGTKDITVRMLLNHSSGLMGSTLDSALLFDDSDPSSTDLLLERLAPAAQGRSRRIQCLLQRRLHPGGAGGELSAAWTSWTMWTVTSWLRQASELPPLRHPEYV